MAELILREEDDAVVGEAFALWMTSSGIAGRVTEEQAGDLAEGFARGWIGGVMHALARLHEQGDPHAREELLKIAGIGVKR